MYDIIKCVWADLYFIKNLNSIEKIIVVKYNLFYDFYKNIFTHENVYVQSYIMAKCNNIYHIIFSSL